MPRTLVIGALFVAAGVTHTLGAQAPTDGGTPGSGLDPRVSQAFRERLSVGYDQRRDSSGIVQRVAPDRPLAHQVLVVPESIPSLAPRPGAPLCPMPVATVEPRALARMPVARADTARIEKMPTVRSGCDNPLDTR